MDCSAGLEGLPDEFGCRSTSATLFDVLLAAGERGRDRVFPYKRHVKDSGMRLYFHLAAVHDSILDEVGIEVEDLDDARSEAIRAIADMRVEDHFTVQNFSGWRLEVTDAFGAVVFSINFTEP